MIANRICRTKNHIDRGLLKSPSVVDGAVVARAKMFALTLSLFFHLPPPVALLLVSRTRLAQATVILTELLFAWPTVPGLQPNTANPRRTPIATRASLAPEDELIDADRSRDLAYESTVTSGRPPAHRAVDLFAPPADGL